MIEELQAIIQDRAANPKAGSYTTSLFEAGIERIAQKVGEEGVEVIVASLAQDDAALVGEAADLVYHLLVLLAARNLTWAQVEGVLRERHG